MAVEIYTDGSSLGNPGPGGFGAIIKKDDEYITVKGGAADTTNNRMEMSAIIAGLYYLQKIFPKEKIVTVFSDSSLVISTLTQGWKRKKNTDLWEKLDTIIGEFEKINWRWIRGHNGHKENEMADKVAVGEAKKWQRTI